MTQSRPNRIAAAVFAAQALLGVAWWIWLAASNDAAALFSPPADEAPTILRFALADLVVFVGGSAAVVTLVVRGSRWAAPAAWCVTGAVAYAALWCVGVAAWHATSWIGAALMVPTAALDSILAARLSRADG